jgi:Zn-finger nucleic acid-binding protein
VDIIWSYTVCSDCGAIWVEGAELERIVAEATCAEEFLHLVDVQMAAKEGKQLRDALDDQKQTE